MVTGKKSLSEILKIEAILAVGSGASTALAYSALTSYLGPETFYEKITDEKTLHFGLATTVGCAVCGIAVRTYQYLKENGRK